MALLTLIFVAAGAGAVMLTEARVAVLLSVVIVKSGLAVGALNIEESVAGAVFEFLRAVRVHRT